MNDYEITYISDPQLAEEAHGQLDAGIDNKITELGGISLFASPSLRRRLAYEVNKNQAGFLRCLQIQLDPGKLAGVQEYLRKEPSVLRYTVLKSPRREEVSAEIIERYVPKKMANKKDGKPGRYSNTKPNIIKKPRVAPVQKEVTMADVEKGIEEALSEEVK